MSESTGPTWDVGGWREGLLYPTPHSCLSQMGAVYVACVYVYVYMCTCVHVCVFRCGWGLIRSLCPAHKACVLVCFEYM